MEARYIGSGDVHALLAGKDTKGHKELMERFVGNKVQRRNSLNCGIPQLETGAILEGRFYSCLPSGVYCPQYPAVCKEISVLRSHLDFAKVKNVKVQDFIEVKTMWQTEFNVLSEFKGNNTGALKFIKRFYPKNYQQVQFQMLCTGLPFGKLTYIKVYTYDKWINMRRRIKPEDCMQIIVPRDEELIGRILERGEIFQSIEDYFKSE